ncbi:PLDc_N domain-containing protein [Puteibacter caeruleilacunae]|nr:PLDc_N domain-containing protein [Puteibacter caeruleilacunae]
MTLLGFIGTSELLIFGIGALFIGLFPVLAIVDIVSGHFRGPNDKLMWVLIVLFMNFLGAVAYFLVGRNQRIKKY